MRTLGNRSGKRRSIKWMMRAEHQRQISEAQVAIEESLPEMAEAITRIDAAESFDDLETALFELGDAYEPVFRAFVVSDDSRSIADLHAMHLVWFKPALRKAHTLVEATGRTLDPADLLDLKNQAQRRDYPNHTDILGNRPLPPRAESALLLRAAKSWAQVDEPSKPRVTRRF